MGVVTRLAAMVNWRDATDHPYECKLCGHGFRLQYHCCPECGGHRVNRAEWPLE